MAKITIDDVIDFLNNNDEDKIELYGGVENIVKIIAKKGRLHDIDIVYTSPNLEDHINKILLTLITSENEEIRKQTLDTIKTKILNNDLVKKGDDWYMVLDNMEDLSMFFCDSNRGWSNQSTPYEIVISVFREDGWEPFYNTLDNIYDDVIDELSVDNLQRLSNKMIEELTGIQVDVETDLLVELCEENEECEGNTIFITPEMMPHILRDKETSIFIISKYLDELHSNLLGLQSQAYNDAYHSEVYESIWDELKTYLDSDSDTKSEWVSKQITRGDKQVTQYKYYLKVTNLVDKMILTFLRANPNSSSTLHYQGGLSETITQLIHDRDIECLRFSIPDYPDHRRVRNNINNNFNEYI